MSTGRVGSLPKKKKATSRRKEKEKKKNEKQRGQAHVQLNMGIFVQK